ncbi:hypothetical protein V8C35DRAFT_145835 [Trichoderma chlorosporum]
MEKRKRPRADDPRPDQVPSKKPRSSPSNFPPEFYDSLSTIWLTSRAKRELDRRNKDQAPSPSKSAALLARRRRSAKVAALGRLGVSKLALFATDGGPDLSDLRGYPEPTSTARAMTSTTPASSKQTQSTKPTTVTVKSRRSSAYDANFKQHLIDNNIYPPLYDFPDDRKRPKPANWEAIRQALKVPRRSLSPSTNPDSAFEDFQCRNKSESEGTIMRNVVPLIAGNINILNEGHIPFTNLDSITSDTTVNPVPDFCDGARPGDLDRKVREDLDRIIIPTKKAGFPVAPNFFLEVKGSGGTIKVADGQAVLDGAYGASIMHALQNYLQAEPLYDGNAYAFSSTLLGGLLTLYAHHITAPVAPGQRPCQHTTQLKAYALTGDYDFWLEGTGAFRNLRVLAKDYRDQFIKTANARARGQHAEAADTEGTDLASTIEEEQQGGSSPLDFYDCETFAEPEDDEPETQETQDANAGLAILHDGYDKDASDDTEASAGFGASFAESFTSVSREDHPRRQPKPPRTPPSPSSPRLAKKRAPPSKADDGST